MENTEINKENKKKIIDIVKKVNTLVDSYDNFIKETGILFIKIDTATPQVIFSNNDNFISQSVKISSYLGNINSNLKNLLSIFPRKLQPDATEFRPASAADGSADGSDSASSIPAKLLTMEELKTDLASKCDSNYYLKLFVELKKLIIKDIPTKLNAYNIRATLVKLVYPDISITLSDLFDNIKTIIKNIEKIKSDIDFLISQLNECIKHLKVKLENDARGYALSVDAVRRGFDGADIRPAMGRQVSIPDVIDYNNLQSNWVDLCEDMIDEIRRRRILDIDVERSKRESKNKCNTDSSDKHNCYISFYFNGIQKRIAHLTLHGSKTIITQNHLEGLGKYLVKSTHIKYDYDKDREKNIFFTDSEGFYYKERTTDPDEIELETAIVVTLNKYRKKLEKNTYKKYIKYKYKYLKLIESMNNNKIIE